MKLDIISSNKFSFKDNCFVADISELPKYSHNRIFDDAVDEGFAIKSEKTGKVLNFAYVGQDSDGEETFGWKYKCTDRKFSHLKILVIND